MTGALTFDGKPTYEELENIVRTLSANIQQVSKEAINFTEVSRASFNEMQETIDTQSKELADLKLELRAEKISSIIKGARCYDRDRENQVIESLVHSNVAIDEVANFLSDVGRVNSGV